MIQVEGGFWEKTGNGVNDWREFLPKTTWSQVIEKPSWIGNSKPSYSWSEITDKPDLKNYVKKDGDIITGELEAILSGASGLTSYFSYYGFVSEGSARKSSLTYDGLAVEDSSSVTQYKNGYVAIQSPKGSPAEIINFPTKAGTLALKLDSYPVGSIYLCWYYASSTSDTYHPAKLFGGSWTAIPSGYALWTYRSSVSSTDSAHEVSAGLPNITGQFGNPYMQADSADSNWSIINGAFSIGNNWDAYLNTSNGTKLKSGQILFDASKSSSVYGKSTTVQPSAYRVFAWRRTA